MNAAGPNKREALRASQGGLIQLNQRPTIFVI